MKRLTLTNKDVILRKTVSTEKRGEEGGHGGTWKEEKEVLE